MNETMPDRIYAVGGGGIQLAKTMFEEDWVMEETLRPREGGAESVEVYMFDTALGERTELREDLRAIQETRDEKKSELRQDSERYGEVGNVEFNTQVLTDGLNLTTSLDLTEASIVDRIAQDQQFAAEDWWIEQADIDENLDFSAGVYRRRALARATYFRAAAETRSLYNDIDMPRSGRAAVIVGLGGGTGSGLCIDFCRRLLSQSPTSDITLFGVLPGPNEDDRVHANAYAALSELEHVQLGGDHGAGTGGDALFKDVVLLPIDPTEYEGKKGDRLGTTAQLKEFDTAFTYPFLSYYNTEDNEELFDEAPDYAPFTIAVPQVLRYSVDAIRTARTALEQSVGSLTDKYRAGRDLHRSAQEFLHGQFDGSGEATLTENQRVQLSSRLDELESFIGTDLFHEQGYVSAEQFEQDLLKGAREESNGDIGQTIETLETLSDGFSNRALEFVDETDEELATLIEIGAEFLATRLRTLREVSMIQDRTIKKALTTKLAVGQRDINAVKLKEERVQERCDDLEREAMVLEDELADAEEELEAAIEEHQEAVERRVTTWERETEAIRGQLRRADEVDHAERFDALEDELREFAREIEDADNQEEVEKVTERGIKDALDELERGLERIGLEDGLKSDHIGSIDHRAIERSLDTLGDARLASLKTDADGGLLSKLWKTSADKEAEQAVNDLREARSNLSRSVFEIKGGETSAFTAEVRPGSQLDVSEVRRYLDDNRGAVLRELDAVLDGELEATSREELVRLLENRQFGAASRMAEEVIEEDLAVPDELTETQVSLQAELAEKEAELERYEATLEELEGSSVGGGRLDYQKAESAFLQAQNRYSEVGDDVSTDDDHLYVKRVQPRESVYEQNNNDIATAALLDDTAEKARAKRVIDNFADQSLEHQYLSLKERRIVDGAGRYHGTKISVGVLSRARREDIGSILEVGDRYEQAFGVQDSFGSWHEQIGDNWDIGMSVFISGVFLDNLRNIPEYRSGYLARKEKARSIHLHHSLGLEEGALSRRAKLLNIRDDEDIGLLTGHPDEAAVIDEFLDMSEQVGVGAARTENPDLGDGSQPRDSTSMLDEQESAQSQVETEEASAESEPTSTTEEESAQPQVETEEASAESEPTSTTAEQESAQSRDGIEEASAESEPTSTTAEQESAQGEVETDGGGH